MMNYKDGGMTMVKKDGKTVPDFAADGLKHGGNVKGMHRMPDGKMMKNSAHDDMKHGGKVKGMHRMPDGKMMKNSAHDDMKKTRR